MNQIYSTERTTFCEKRLMQLLHFT